MEAVAFLRHLGFALGLAVLSALVVRLMIAFPILDHPDHRKAHARPTPKGGGLGIVAAFLVGMLVLYHVAAFARLADPQFIGVIVAALAIAGVALADDLRDFRFIVKLGAQCVAALVALGSGLVLHQLALPGLGVVPLGWLGPVLTVFWIVGCTNAVNFMDGLDGLVAGATLIACLFLAVIGVALGGWFLYAAALILAAGLLGFLPFNWHPARIFMGDVGSQFLGFMLAVLAIAAARYDAAQTSFLLMPLLLFGLLFDAAFTLLRRAAMGEAVSRPHRGHLYQMAQRCGMPVRAVAGLHCGFAVWQGGLGLLFLQLSASSKPLVILAALVPQLLWLGYVLRRVRALGIPWKV